MGDQPVASSSANMSTRNVDGEIDKLGGETTYVDDITNAEASAFAMKAGNAREAASSETHMTLGKALRLYPKAAAWSALISTTIVMVAYDTVLLNSFFAYPSFTRKYGKLAGKKYEISAAWQSGLSNGSNVGT